MADSLGHDRAYALLPWLVNGTLAGEERAAVEAHVRGCVTCRRALREEHGLRAAIRERPIVPLSAAQGFEQIAHRLERDPPRPRRRQRMLTFLPAGAAAAALLGIVALGLALLLRDLPEQRGPGEYRTSSDSAPAGDVHLDIVFANDITERDMRAVLTEIGAEVVGGPSDIGRYTAKLASPALTEQDVDTLLERLERDSRVRFAGRSLIRRNPPQ